MTAGIRAIYEFAIEHGQFIVNLFRKKIVIFQFAM